MTDKRKRAAPTIDLTATEVPPAEGAHAAEPPPPREEPPADEQRIKSYVTPIAAGFAGAILAGAAIWAIGLMPNGSSDRSEIVALQKQIQALQNRPAPAPAAAPDIQALDALRQRVGKIEHDIANLPPGDKSIAERLAAADGAMKSLGVALAALSKRGDDASADAKQAQQSAAAAEKAVSELRDSVQNAKQQASSAVDAGQFEAVHQRVAALEQSVKAAHEQISKSATIDRAARLALVAADLRNTVARGAPYQAELAQVKSLGADEHALAPLAPFAGSGLPSQQALARELGELIPALLKAAGTQAAPTGFLERLQANASRLVRVQPVDAPPGDNPSDVLARIEVAAAHADINSALADLAKLPEAARAPAQAWIAKAKARQDALAAARRFASDTANALGK